MHLLSKKSSNAGKSQKEDYSGFKVTRVLKEISNLGVEMNNLVFWEAK